MKAPLAIGSATLALLFGSGCRPSSSAPVEQSRAAPITATSLLSSPPPVELAPIPASRLCVTSGKIAPVGPLRNQVDVGGMRGFIAGDRGQAAEIAFTYEGPSATTTPLANGELRRQIGLKLRAKDTCNVVYVMWHVAPTPGIGVSVKVNPSQSTHAACGAGGYENLHTTPGAHAPDVKPGERHVLRAILDGHVLRVTADGIPMFDAPLPDDAFTFDGPAGVRSDNGKFDFELRVPPSTTTTPPSCP